MSPRSRDPSGPMVSFLDKRKNPRQRLPFVNEQEPAGIHMVLNDHGGLGHTGLVMLFRLDKKIFFDTHQNPTLDLQRGEISGRSRHNS